MLDEKSRQDVDTNLQDVAQIPGRRLRLWSFACRASVRGPDEEHGVREKPGQGAWGREKPEHLSFPLEILFRRKPDLLFCPN